MKLSLKTSIVLSSLTASLLFVGCNDGHDTSNPDVKVESKLAKNSALRADENDIVIVNLEHQGAQAHPDDLHAIGSDCFKYRFENPVTLDISLDANSTLGSQSLTHTDTGTLLSSVTPGMYASSVTLEANTDYTHCVNSHSNSNATQTLFIRMVDDSDSKKLAPSAGSVASNTKKLISSRDCPSCNLSGANLNGTNLSGANLSNANLSLAWIMNANLSYANLSGANLERANMSDSNLTHANLNNATINNAYLIRSDLSYASINYAYLNSSNLDYADLSFATTTGSQIIGSSLYRATLYRANLSYTFLTNADLREANLIYANMGHSDLRWSNMLGASIFRFYVRYSDLYGAVWSTGISCTASRPGICMVIGANPISQMEGSIPSY